MFNSIIVENPFQTSSDLHFKIENNTKKKRLYMLSNKETFGIKNVSLQNEKCLKIISINVI